MDDENIIKKLFEPDLYRKGNWASDATYRCAVCHTVTNRWMMEGSSAKDDRHLQLICPCSDYRIHSQLEDMLAEKNKVDSQIYEYQAFLDFGGTDAGIDSSLESLYRRSELLETKIKKARQRTQRIMERISKCVSGLEISKLNDDTEDFTP